MGQLGFSYIGLIWLAMLVIPNLFWTKCQPQGYTTQGENRGLLCLERVGQVLVSCTVLIFSDFNIHPEAGWWNLWLAASFLLMLLYEYWWIRYFKSSNTRTDFYRSLLGVPVAGATLPVAAFLLLGIYGRNFWLLIATGILGIGHIGIHLQHKNNDI